MEVITAAGDAESIGQVVCNRVQQLHAKLLVLAPHSKGAVRRILVGSVTDYCAKHCTAPVLIVKEH
jgi:nucleotide-binding universal stress UspA family protein